MNLDDKLATRVGAVSLVVLGAAIVFFVFISGRIEWGAHLRIHVFMHTAGNLREGAPFVVGGRTVGHVEAIGLSPRGAHTPLGGDEGVVITVALATADLDRVSRGGDVFVSSRGALSERYLELGPAPDRTASSSGDASREGPLALDRTASSSGDASREGPLALDRGTPFHDGDEVLGRDPPSLDRVLQRTWDNLTNTARFADDLRPEMRRFLAELDRLLGDATGLAPPLALRDDLVATLAEGRRTYDTGLGGDAGIEHARATVARTRAVVAEMRTTLDQLQARVTALRTAVVAMRGKLDARIPPLLDSFQLAIDRGQAVMGKIDPMLAVIDEIADRLARGEGTVGKLANDPEFPEDAKDLGKLLKRQPWKVIGHPDDH